MKMAKKKNERTISDEVVKLIEDSIKKRSKKEEFRKKIGAIIDKRISDWKK